MNRRGVPIATCDAITQNLRLRVEEKQNAPTNKLLPASIYPAIDEETIVGKMGPTSLMSRIET
jgi:hypothetical protein